MKTIKTTKFPSLYYTNEKSASEDADKIGANICRIIFIQEWNGETEESFMGFGLINKEGKLLGTKDFNWI